MEVSTPTILVVDDDDDLRAMLMEFLQGVGYATADAPDGEIALRLLEAEPARFQLVLLDLLMPLVDGYVFRRMQRANPAIADIPVITLSASAIVRQRGLPDGIGPDNFMAKPADIEALLALVAFHCGPPTP